jgi:hypothetical protein
MTASTRDAGLPGAPEPLACTWCLGACETQAPCAVHIGGCDCSTGTVGCAQCSGTGFEPCTVCDSSKHPAVDVIDGLPLCAECVRLDQEDQVRAKQQARLTIHLEAKRRIDRTLWLGLDLRVRWHLIAIGAVTTDALDGTPIISEAVSAQMVLNILKGIAHRPAARTA